jgi:hypothetical protein
MRSFDQFLAVLAVLAEIPDPRRAEGKLYKLPCVLLFSILAVVTGGNSFRSVETFIKVHRRRLNVAFGLAGSAPRPIPPSATSCRASIRSQSSRCSAATPLVCGMPHPIHRDAPSRWMGRRCGEASTISATARPPNCCMLSTPTPDWSWRTSTSQRNPTRSPPRSSCLANSRLRTASSRSMPCTAKKNLRGRRTSAGRGYRPTEGQSAYSAAKCRSYLCLTTAHQQQHRGHCWPRPA